jgi:pimeloyl-ACP methyl ester carboxylesterase
MEEQPDGTIRPRLSRQNHMKILRTMWETRPVELLSQVRCPALIVTAQYPASGESGQEAADLKSSPPGLKHDQKLLTDVKVIEMEDTIHDIPLHRPQRLAQEITSFFSANREP